MLVVDSPAHGAVSSISPIASEVGLSILRDGGNAADAAAAMAATLAVVDPAMTGIGGDAFALVHFAGEPPIALNASGAAPKLATVESFRERELDSVPEHGPLSITAPGAVLGWHALAERFGTRLLPELLQPAIELARDGFEVTPFVSLGIGMARGRLARDESARRIFLKDDGSPHPPGERLVQADLARSLEAIASDGPAALYGGELGRRFERGLIMTGALVSLEDLVRQTHRWVEPLRTRYRGREVLVPPPNSHGLTLLWMLNLLEPEDLESLPRNSADRVHLQVEAKKIAFLARHQYIGDPDRSDVDPFELASKEYAAKLRPLLERKNISRLPPRLPEPPGGQETTYFGVVDAAGNAVSFMSSLFDAFGSGIVAGDTGIVCHNRGSSFSLDPSHPNALGPGRLPMHTLMPALVLEDERPRYVLGCIGGDMQPQGLLSILTELVDRGADIEGALEAPRWRSYDEGRLALEPGLSGLGPELEQRGHHLVDEPVFGVAQIIERRENGSLRAASDPRVPGTPLGE